MGRSEVPASVVKWSEGLSNRASIIISIAVSFITLFPYFFVPFCIVVYKIVCIVRVCLILQIMYSYSHVWGPRWHSG